MLINKSSFILSEARGRKEKNVKKKKSVRKLMRLGIKRVREFSLKSVHFRYNIFVLKIHFFGLNRMSIVHFRFELS